MTKVQIKTTKTIFKSLSDSYFQKYIPSIKKYGNIKQWYLIHCMSKALKWVGHRHRFLTKEKKSRVPGFPMFSDVTAILHLQTLLDFELSFKFLMIFVSDFGFPTHKSPNVSIFKLVLLNILHLVCVQPESWAFGPLFKSRWFSTATGVSCLMPPWCKLRTPGSSDGWWILRNCGFPKKHDSKRWIRNSFKTKTNIILVDVALPF